MSKAKVGPMSDAATSLTSPVQSPVPPSVCPSEFSTSASAHGASPEQFSDTSSNTGSEVSTELQEQLTEWLEVGDRLAQIFKRLADEDSEDSDEDTFKSCFRSLSHSGNSSCLTTPCSGSQSQSRIVTRSSTIDEEHDMQGPDKDCSDLQRHAMHEQSGPSAATRLLFEHYGAFGAPSGYWSGSNDGVGTEEPEAEHESGDEAVLREDPQHISSRDSAWAEANPWHFVGAQLSRALLKVKSNLESDC
mmetsp:Transcript_62543/g.123592  ORF Transcript_62543/g.123592 Transcript_62543/m.123592 type:complete len:247 (-) Transcript_62543:236-976(-)